MKYKIKKQILRTNHVKKEKVYKDEEIRLKH